MGGSESRVAALTEILNSTAIDITASVGSKMSNVAQQLQAIRLTNLHGVSIRDIEMAQKLKIDASSLTQANINADLQNKLMAGIMTEIEKQKNGFPEITSSKSDTEIRNIIKNEISAKFSVAATSEMVNSISSEQVFEVSNSSGLDVSKVRMVQEADAVYKQINQLASDIATQLVGEADVSNKSKETQDNPIAKVTDSLFQGLGNVFGVDASTMVGGVIVLVVAIIAGIFLMRPGQASAGMPMPGFAGFPGFTGMPSQTPWGTGMQGLPGQVPMPPSQYPYQQQYQYQLPQANISGFMQNPQMATTPSYVYSQPPPSR